MPYIPAPARALAALVVMLALGTLATPSARATANLADGQQACLVASETLETLTERAAVTPTARLVAEVRVATARVKRCEDTLPPAQKMELANVVVRLNRFKADRNRAALALSAVEGFRTLVAAQTRGPSDLPLEVALLDYAGFRYQAGTQAIPALWGELKLAVDIADEQWRTLSPRISDRQLQTSFAASIEAMRTAELARNVQQARHAASSELKLVDALEKFFSRHRSPSAQTH